MTVKKGKRRKARGQQSGGGGWKEMNESMARNRAKRLVESGAITETEAELLASGTSIFDPVLCELAYSWFCPPKGVVLDPFAGGSVRGIVASRLGRAYVGVDLSARQIAANNAQAKRICTAPLPKWVEGDSQNLAKLAPNLRADFIFSCPPYYDLEVYSEDKRDLSTMAWGGFVSAYENIIAEACAKLKDNRFACFVVGDVRDKAGMYRGLPAVTTEAFRNAGLYFYNDAVLVTAVGSLPIRIRKQFEGARKLGKTHQNVLVYVKGDPKKATEAVGPVEFGALEIAEHTNSDERIALSVSGEV